MVRRNNQTERRQHNGVTRDVLIVTQGSHKRDDGNAEHRDALVPAQFARRKAHFFAEIQTSHHGAGGNHADNPQATGPHLGQPGASPRHRLLKRKSREGDNSARQSG